jgi:hypothetical protein
MAVIINELEIVLDPDTTAQKDAPKTNGKTPDPPKTPLAPQDFLTVYDREHRNYLRLMAH